MPLSGYLSVPGLRNESKRGLSMAVHGASAAEPETMALNACRADIAKNKPV